jgi:hypothetical protein
MASAKGSLSFLMVEGLDVRRWWWSQQISRSFRLAKMKNRALALLCSERLLCIFTSNSECYWLYRRS